MIRQVKASSTLAGVFVWIANAGVLTAALFLLLGVTDATVAWGQDSPEVSFPITVSTDAGSSQELSLGLDSSATAGIDSSFGEVEQPPLPPSGVFDARLIDDDIPPSGFGEGLLVDIREGSADFTGTKMHEIRVQPDEEATEVTIDWDLPEGVTGQLKDVVTDGELVDEPMIGDSSYVLTNLDVRKLEVTLKYDKPNVSPEASDDSYETTEGRRLKVSPSEGVLANDTDENEDELTASVVEGVDHGTLALNEDGSFSYAPATGFSGEDSLTYEVADGRGGTDQATVSIDVRARSAPAVSFPITVSDDTSSQELTLGLDPEATSGIDPTLGEEEQPPTPPSGIFDARLVDSDGDFGEGLIRDLREGTRSFTGLKRHRIEYQPSEGAQEVTISWNLPEGVTGQLEDAVTGGDEISQRMSGSGSTTLTNLDIRKLNVILNYGPPVATTDRYRSIKDSTLEVTQPSNGVLANDSGADLDSLGVSARLITDASNGNLTLNEDGTFEYTLSPGEDFVAADSFKYAANDQNPGDSQTDEAWAHISIQPETITVSVSRSFGDATGPDDYRLVALPGQSNRSLAATVNGEAGTEWQAYWDNGSDSDFLVRFDGSDRFNFQAGRGFWLTSRQEWSVEDDIATISLEGDTSATIPLNDGWTIISNPFGESVDWDAVEHVNGADLQPLWSFGGTFDSTKTFGSARQGVAYYFFNDTGQDALEIPYPGALETGEISKKSDSSAPLLTISAIPAQQGGAASKVRLGLAEAQGTENALVAPPGRFSAVSLRIEAEADKPTASSDQITERTRLLMASRRAPDGTGETFRLRLTSRTAGPVRLSASNLRAVKGQEVALLDPKTGRTYDLRTEGPVTLDPNEDAPRNLKVAVGSKRYVEKQKETVLPEEVRLTSYPNPVRQRGTLKYALPNEQKVSLKVYDVLGRKVATLASGRREAGRHTVHFETGQLASGVYFGRLRAGNQTRTLKITVVR